MRTSMVFRESASFEGPARAPDEALHEVDLGSLSPRYCPVHVRPVFGKLWGSSAVMSLMNPVVHGGWSWRA